MKANGDSMALFAYMISHHRQISMLSTQVHSVRGVKMHLFQKVTIAFAFLFAFYGHALAQDIKVTLLGTGSPPPAMNRFGPSILVEAGDKKFLFDAGRGAMQRLAQTRTRWQDIDGIFFTHLHSDHIVGFPDVWLTGWLVGAGRNRALDVWGPAGTAKMIAHLAQAFEFDIRNRISNDHAHPDGILVNAYDIKPGIRYENGGVKITAIEVDHSPIEPAYGYRIDFGGRSVVLSGDTRPSENLIRAAEGVDLFVHEVVSPETLARAGLNAERAASIIEHHTTPEQAGKVFARTRPRLAVYSHIILATATNDDLIPGTRKAYDGPLEVGEDLMVIEVGKEISVRRPSIPRQ